MPLRPQDATALALVCSALLFDEVSLFLSRFVGHWMAWRRTAAVYGFKEAGAVLLSFSAGDDLFSQENVIRRRFMEETIPNPTLPSPS